MPSRCGCGKCANFNYDGEKAEYCVKCKFADMIDVVNKKCIKCNVTRATFNYDGEKAR